MVEILNSKPSRAMGILQRNEEKRQEKINAILVAQRLAIREDVLNNLDEGKDEYLVASEALLQKIRSAEEELQSIHKSINDEVEKARATLKLTRKTLKEAQQEADDALAEAVERTARLKHLNDREEAEFKTQEKIFEALKEAEDTKKKLEPEIIRMSAEMTAKKKNKETIDRVFMDKALATYTAFKGVEDTIETLKRSSVNGRGGMAAMLEQRTKDLKDAHTAMKETSETAYENLIQAQEARHETSLMQAQALVTLQHYINEKLVLNGMNEFLEQDTEEDFNE